MYAATNIDLGGNSGGPLNIPFTRSLTIAEEDEVMMANYGHGCKQYRASN